MRWQSCDGLPAQHDPSGVGPQVPGDQVEEGRLARAVRSDHCMALTLGQQEVDTLHRDEAVE